MGRYRDGWVLTTAVIATVGAWTALQTWPPVGVLGCFLAGAFVGGAIAESAAREAGRRWLRPVIARGVLTGVALVAAAGLAELLGATALLVLGVLAAAYPGLWVTVRSWRASRKIRRMEARWTATPRETGPSTPRGRPRPALEVPSEPRLLDDYALCSAWRMSYVVLEHQHSPETYLHVVQQRQRYLDELERRNPTGIATWLASGARAASDPTRYIVPR